MGEMNVLSGMLYCADCGQKMYLVVLQSQRKQNTLIVLPIARKRRSIVRHIK